MRPFRGRACIQAVPEVASNIEAIDGGAIGDDLARKKEFEFEFEFENDDINDPLSLCIFADQQTGPMLSFAFDWSSWDSKVMRGCLSGWAKSQVLSGFEKLTERFFDCLESATKQSRRIAS